MAAIILALVAIGAGSVHLRWTNTHYAFRIQQEYDRKVQLTRQYQERRLELWRRKSPANLKEQIEKWDLQLEGWIKEEGVRDEPKLLNDLD